MEKTEQKAVVQREEVMGFRKYLCDRENAENTVKKYVADIGTFFRYLGEDTGIDKERVVDYKKWLAENYAVSSANSMIAALNQFLRFLGLDQFRVKQLRQQKKRFLESARELTVEEYYLLVDGARKQGKSQLALCIEAIAATGIRISELKYFTVERVRSGRIEIYNKGKYRSIFLPEFLRRKLLRYAGKCRIRRGHLFRGRNGKPKDRSEIWREMKKLGDSTGIKGEKIFPHNLRHLFARAYYQKTKDLAGLADLLGHSSLNVTRIYTLNTGEFYQRQLDKFRLFEYAAT